MAEKKLINVNWNPNPGYLSVLLNLGPFESDKKEVEKIGALLKKHDQAMKEVVGQIDEIAKSADDMIIKTPEHEASAILFLKPLKDFSKKIEDKRKEIVGPANEFVKMVNGTFKPRLDQIDKIERQIKGKMSDYRREVEEAARVEQAKLDEKNRKAAEKYQDKVSNAIENGKDPASIKMPVIKNVEVPDTTTKTDNASATYRTIKKYRIIKESQIPLQYWQLNEKKIAKAVRAGVEIPGVQVYEEKEPAIR